jgi:hypothetical protein
MPVPKPAVLTIAACAVASAITSCSGDLATGTTANAGPDVDAGPIGAPPNSAVRQVSLAMTHVNFGDSPTADAWKQIGFNLDGRVTTATSTDVCQLEPGANPAAQDDGQDGIDNSFGENLCPILDTTFGVSSYSTAVPQTYVVTDASGSGTLAIQFAGTTVGLKIPIVEAHVVVNDDGSGMLGAVAPTAGMINALDAAAAAANRCTMAGGQPDSILTQFEQASDIRALTSLH